MGAKIPLELTLLCLYTKSNFDIYISVGISHLFCHKVVIVRNCCIHCKVSLVSFLMYTLYISTNLQLLYNHYLYVGIEMKVYT